MEIGKFWYLNPETPRKWVIFSNFPILVAEKREYQLPLTDSITFRRCFGLKSRTPELILTTFLGQLHHSLTAIESCSVTERTKFSKEPSSNAYVVRSAHVLVRDWFWSLYWICPETEPSISMRHNEQTNPEIHPPVHQLVRIAYKDQDWFSARIIQENSRQWKSVDPRETKMDVYPVSIHTGKTFPPSNPRIFFHIRITERAWPWNMEIYISDCTNVPGCFHNE